MAIQGPNGASLEEIETFLRLEQPKFSAANDVSEASRRLFEFFRKYPGFTDFGERIYPSPSWSAEVLGTKNTRLSEDGEPVFRAVAASFSHGILATEISSKTKLDSRQVSRFIKILSGNRLVYSLSVTLTGAIKDYWGTNTSNIVWATIFLGRRSDEELREAFIEYTRGLSSFGAHSHQPEGQKAPTAMMVCQYLASTGREQAYEDILDHFIKELGVDSAKARKTLNVQLDTITTALDKAGVLGSYVKLGDTLVYSRFLTPQSLSFKPLSAIRRENKGSQNIFHMSPMSPMTFSPNFLFLTSAQTLASAQQVLPSLTLYPIDGFTPIEVSLLIPLTYGNRVSTVTELLLIKIFQAGEEGIQLTNLRDQFCLARKVMEWISDVLVSSFPVVKSEESGAFKYWYFPHGPQALYTPLFDSPAKTSSGSGSRRSFERKIRYGYSRLAGFLSTNHSGPTSSALSVSLSTNSITVHEMHQEEDSPLKQTLLCATPTDNAPQKPSTPILTPLGCFFPDALECALITYDTQRNIAMSAKAQLILSFFRLTPLYIQQDLVQLASLLPAEVYTSFPLSYGFKDLTKKKTDRKVVQRSIDYLLETGYILESSVSIGAKTCTVYYRSDIFVMGTHELGDSPTSGFLQNMPNLLDRLKVYLSTLPTLLARDETDAGIGADLEQDYLNDPGREGSAELSSGSESSTLSWMTSCMPELTGYESTDVFLHDLNSHVKRSNVKVVVLAGSTRSEQSMAQVSAYLSSCSETLMAIKADISRTKRKYTLRKLMLLHIVLLQSIKDMAHSSVSDISLCEALTFSEYAYLFPFPESSPLYHLFLPYLLSFPNTFIYKVSNPALYLLVLNNFFVLRMGKYREWLQHIDLLHWSIEQPDAKIKNHIHRTVSHLPSLKLSDLKRHPIILNNVLSALYSSLYVSGIGATIRAVHEADTINIELLEPISVSTEQELVLFWSLLEDFSLRVYMALKLCTDEGPISLSCLCNELAIYTLIRSWIVNSETLAFLKERLGDLDFASTIQSSVSKAQEAAMSLCDTIGQQGVIVHINAFMGAVQKELQRLFEAEECSYARASLQHSVTNLLILDYHSLATAAVSDLPLKYLDLHFDGSLDKAFEYYRSSQWNTLHFILHSMKIVTLAFYDFLSQSEPNDHNPQHCVYIPSVSLKPEDIDKNILIQCVPDTRHKVHKVQLSQALVARASAPVSYWVDKVLLNMRPRGGNSSSLSINMQPTDSRGTEYCSMSLFTNSPWLLAFSTESIAAMKATGASIFQKYNRDIQRMRSARSSRLTPALQRQRHKQKQELHLREEFALLLCEESEPKNHPTEQVRALTVEDLTEMVAQYRASRRYISLSDDELRYWEHCMMHYMSLFRVVSPWMRGYASSKPNSEEDGVVALLQEQSSCTLTAVIEKYIKTNATKRDFITYGRIYSMAALSLVSPEIDVLIDLPSAKERSLLLGKFSDVITSIVRNTYRERQLSDPSETVRVANLLYLLTNKINQSPSKKLQSKLLIEKDILINCINSDSLKVEFDFEGAADPDCITYVYDKRFFDLWQPGFLLLCNDIARQSSASPATCYDCSHMIDAEEHISLLIQCILSCNMLHHANPIITYNTDQRALKVCYSTHRLLLRRTDYTEKQSLSRSGDTIQSLISFLCLPYLCNAIIHSTNVLLNDTSNGKALACQRLRDIVCSFRNKAILQQHKWAREIRMFMACTLWNPSQVNITADGAALRAIESMASNSMSDFSLQYLLASGYARQQEYGSLGYSVSKTLQKPSLISADSRNSYLSNIDMGTMTVHHAFLLLPSILFGLHRQRYRLSGSTIEELRIIDPCSIIDLEFGEEDTSFNPVEDILETYAGMDDAVSAMIGDAIQGFQEIGLELVCPLVNLTEDCNSTQKQGIDILLQKYNDTNLSLTLFNCPESKDILLGSGFFVPRRLITETVFVPLETFLASSSYEQFATEFSAISPANCSIDYADGNRYEAELSLRQIISLISLCPGITLDRLCTACVPLLPTTVCFLLNILIWDEAVEARVMVSLPDGYSVQKVIPDILVIESTEFSRVVLSTNVEHLADGLYNNIVQT